MTQPAKPITDVARIRRYVDQVLDGTIPACKWVKLACERHLRDLARVKDPAWPYTFDETKAARVLKFVQVLPHVKGKWAKVGKEGKRETLKLEDWQCFLFGSIFGWVTKKDGLRRFTKASWYMPRKNSKSTMAAAVGWWMFAKDGEPGAEVYCGATTENQAWEVFDPARNMAQFEPRLATELGVKVYGKSLHRAEDNSRFEPVIGKPGDGASVHCAIVDEYHEHLDSVLYDTMKTGVMAREQPLVLVISTAGSNLAGPCREDWRDVEKLLEGAYQNEAHFGIIYTMDEGDDWTSEIALRKANPNWGVSVNPALIMSDLAEAIRDPAKAAVFKTKHIDLWVTAKHGWMNMERWNLCADPSLRMEQFLGQPCWVAIDAASRVDVFSVVAIFERGDELVVFDKHFMPEDTVNLPHNQHMQKWQELGQLTATEGARTDQRIVSDLLKEWAERFYIQELAYDPRELNLLMQEIQTWCSFPCVEITQSPALMSEPMKELEAKVATRKIRHTGSLPLAWMASNVVRKEARSGGPVKYYYPTKETEKQKIDGIVALIMALSRRMASTGTGGVGVGFF